MRIAIIGGKLQGLEAVYLAKKAGIEVVLIDKEEKIPARNLADSFYCLDVMSDDLLASALENVDLVIPALEENNVLENLSRVCRQIRVAYAFDPDAYAISSSKLRSDLFLKDRGVPVPCYYPHCSYPVIAKPSESSGSEGVALFSDQHTLSQFLHDIKNDRQGWVIQEYLEGPSFSLEVVGWKGDCRVIQVTDLEMDAGYDCKRVIAPSTLSSLQQKKFAEIGERIAGCLHLNGIMDIEVILHNGELKVLEIDARLPSQTPICVYHSCGINLVDVVANIFLRKALPEHLAVTAEKHVLLEHIRLTPGRLETCGEHVVGSSGPLSHIKNFFGADEAITDYRPGIDSWVATLIITGINRNGINRRRCEIVEKICSAYSVSEYIDTAPQKIL
jgi:pyrrolysine biosynthesis protein PylC